MARKKGSIQFKIIVAMFIVGLLPGLAGVFYTYQSGIKALKNSIGTNFKAIAVDTAEKIDIIINREIYFTQSLAMFLGTDLESAPKSDILNRIEKHHEQRSKEIISITITDNKGAVIASVGRPLVMQWPSESFLKTTTDNRLEKAFIGDIHFDKTTQEYSILIVVPIIDDKNNSMMGSVMVLYNVREIFGIINNVAIGKTGHANLVTSDGILVVCPIYPPQSHAINNTLLSQISSIQPGWGIASDDAHGGQKSIIGFSPVKITLNPGKDNFGGKRWYIFIRQLPDETYAPIYTLLWRVSILGLTLVSLLSLLGYFVARRIVKPIKMLSEGANLIGKGHLDHSLNISTGDEIEELADIFNQMAKDLEKRFQEIKLERQRLLNSERLSALSQFSSTFAHDLRNPIIAVKKTLEMLRDSYSTSREETVKGVYSDLISTCGLLLGLVNDVLDVHQVSYRDLPLLYSSFSLNQALDEVIKLLRIEAEERKVHVRMESNERDVLIEGDRRRIQRVFINLLSNALRYSPPGGNIYISFNQSKLFDRTDKDHIMFKIKDDGPGIAPDELPKIFDLFYKTDKGGIKSGTGLGLYFCKVVVEAHGGRIWAENRDKGGAVFFIEMPLVRREADVYQDSHS